MATGLRPDRRENETGVIPVDEAVQATFTNERNTGTPIVRKSVEGNAGETERYFTFTVFMRDRYGRNVNGSFPMEGGAGENVTFVNGYATISLADGEEGHHLRHPRGHVLQRDRGGGRHRRLRHHLFSDGGASSPRAAPPR